MKKDLDIFDILKAEELKDSKATLPIALIKDKEGNPLDLARLPHLLTAGCLLSGRERSMHSFILPLLDKFSPEELKFLMIDTNIINLHCYNKMPHLLSPVLNDVEEAMAALTCLKEEMCNRYKIFSALKIKKISDFNSKIENGEIDEEKLASLSVKNAKMPYIVCVIDEYMPLIREYKRDFESTLVCLLQVARLAGIHIILSTARVSMSVITDFIKININNALCFKLTSRLDSKIVLDKKGAESLELNDVLFKREDTEDLENVDIIYPSELDINRFLAKQKSNTQYDERFLAATRNARLEQIAV